LLNKQCEDPATRYHGHLLLAHIIAKFAINKKIVLQVFHSLLRAHAVEARGVIRQALEVLTPAIPARMDDGNTVLLHWTKKIIVEEGHTVAQLVHILQLVVRHYKVYYPVRGYLFQYMTNFMQKLGFPPNATIEYRRLAVDLAEVIIKWEMQRIKSDNEHQAEQTAGSDVSTSVVPASQGGSPAQVSGMKRAGEELIQDPKRQKTASGALVRQVTVATRHVLEKHHQDAVVNFLIRIACQVSDQNSATSSGSPGEILSRRCVALLKTALRPDVWPVVELKLAWFEKLLLTVASQASQASQQDQTPNHFPNVCTALEILTLLLSVVHRPAILAMLKPLQRGLVLCMSSDSNKVIRGVHNFLAKLMSLFPTESSTASVSSKYDELEGLYSNVSRVIFEGLQTYERSTTSGGSTTTGLYGTLMMLKAACSHNVCYIDRFISLFMKVLSKMQHEHLSPTEESSIPVMTDMMTLSVELMKTRIPVMSQEMRKNFITLLSTLIEKSSEVRLLRAITKIVEEWIKNKTQLPVQQAPSLREKYHLLYRMMNSYEKRFPNEQELNAQFLDLVYHVFKEDAFQGSELTSKLESAFLAGLRCNQPHVRGKFVQLLDYHLPRELHQRLLYIVQTQNWEFIGPHFWIKQCIELVLAVADGDQPILPASETQSVRDEPFQGSRIVDVIESMETELSLSRNRLKLLKARHEKFLSNAGMVKSSSFVDGVVQLCHEDTSLAFHIWLELFPQTWNLLTEQNLQIISREISPFLCSGAHLTQVDCHPSSIEAFVEAFLRCKPMFCLRPAVLKYIGKNHNLWHQSCLCLEEHVYDCDDLSPQLQAETQEQHKQSREGLQHTISDGDLFGTMRDERLDCLSELYSVLKEDDMWAGLWHKRCRFKETSKAILFEQQGLFEQSQTSYEKAMAIAREEHNHGPQHPAARPEYRLWRDHWLRCCKELGQWSLMTDLGRNRLHPDPYLVLDSVWKIPDWTAMKDALAQVELNSPESLAYKLNLYQGYLSICSPEEQHSPTVPKLVEAASSQAIIQWKRLPEIVSSVHISLLQAAQQIMELQEAAQIRTSLQQGNIGRTASIHDMKALVKTWRIRLPNEWDDLSHWSDIFMWRQHHYQAIVSAYEQLGHAEQSHAMHGVHASAWAIIQHARIARKQDLISVCLDNLSRIHTIPSVPVMDCFQKIKQQVKCYLQSCSALGKGELQEGLDLLESTNPKFFTKDMIAEFFALKGLFYSQMERSEEANKAFSAAVQLSDAVSEPWGLWADYLDQVFSKDRNVDVGVDAMTCYLHACRHNDEIRGNKFLARTLWLLNYDDDTLALAEVIDKYGVGVPPSHWLPWIPQLLSHLIQRDGKQILNLLCTIGRVYPQAIYFPTRTVYLALKIEHREKVKSEMSANQCSSPVTGSQQFPGYMTQEKKFNNSKVPKATGSVSVTETIEPMETDSTAHSGDSKDANSEIEEPTPVSDTTPGLTTPGLITPGSTSRFSFDPSGGVKLKSNR
jgi:transformation/transcription domain-associated protein